MYSKILFSGFTDGVDLPTLLVSLLITTLLAIYIFFIYRLVTRKTFYSKTFNLSLLAMSIITAAIILTIQSNVGYHSVWSVHYQSSFQNGN
jgi:predicted membrane chloride channel (bestrophin family)